MPNVQAIGIRCHYCSDFFTPAEVLQIGDDVRRCLKCTEAHYAALEKLAANPPNECGTCKVTWEQLKERAAGVHIPMYIHWKDGCYQVLCSACDLLYVPKRADLYAPTQFGWDRKIR